MQRLLPHLLLVAGIGLSACRDDSTAPTAPAITPSAGASKGAEVHVVYLVPSDRTVNRTYVKELRNAIKHLQIWYRNELGTGESFTLAKPVVEVFQTDQPGSAYQGSGAPGSEFFINVAEEAFARTGGSFDDPDDIWLVYIDVNGACNQATGAFGSVAVFPANDLRGLAGETTVDPCTGEPQPDQPHCRWVGGMGHELGHTFGLPHPTECEPTQQPECPISAIMWVGYLTYPEATLTEADRAQLAASPFFAPIKLTDRLPSCETKAERKTTPMVASQGMRARLASTLRAPECGYNQLRIAAWLQSHK